MGVATSRGSNNLEMVDNLASDQALESAKIELIFRVVDRGFFAPPEISERVYDSGPWKVETVDEHLYGALHMSSPSIYSSVLEHLHLQKGHSFLNIGSGVGYLSTLAGLLIGSSGNSHGVELNSRTLEYALNKRSEFLRTAVPSCFDFCIPEYYYGNCFNMKLASKYDRIYVGAKVPDGMRLYFAKMLKVGGICIMPYEHTLQSIKRSTEKTFLAYDISPVEFGRLIMPDENHENCVYFAQTELELPKVVRPKKLIDLCTSRVRSAVREAQPEDIIIRQAVHERAEQREGFPYDFSEDEMLSEQRDLRSVSGNEDHRMIPERNNDGYTIFTLQRRRLQTLQLVHIPVAVDEDMPVPFDQRGMDMRDGLAAVGNGNAADNGRQEELQSALETMMHRVVNAVRNVNAIHLPDIVITDEEPSSSADGAERPPEPPRSQSAPIQGETARHFERRHIRQHMERVRERQARPRDNSSASSTDSSSSTSSSGSSTRNRKRKRPADDPQLTENELKKLHFVPAPGLFKRKYIRMFPRNTLSNRDEEASVSQKLQESSVKVFDTGFRAAIGKLRLPAKVQSQLLYEETSGLIFEQKKKNC